jgi:hypothetical protein
VDGSLYSKDGTVLVRYAVGQKVVKFDMPDTVVEIGAYAFSDCYTEGGIYNIVCSDNLKKIGHYAFNNCTTLEYITLPATLESIGMFAFTRVAPDELEWNPIQFNGTSTQWLAIEKGYQWAPSLGGYPYTVYYNCQVYCVGDDTTVFISTDSNHKIVETV